MAIPRVNINLNYDGKELVNWFPRHLTKLFNSEASKREKLIAMARESASRLMLADWDVVISSSDYGTTGVLEILAASKECRCPETLLRMTSQLVSNFKIPRFWKDALVQHYAEVLKLDLRKAISITEDRKHITTRIHTLQHTERFFALSIFQCEDIEDKLFGAAECTSTFKRFRKVDSNCLLIELIPSLATEFREAYDKSLDDVNSLPFPNCITNHRVICKIVDALVQVLAISSVAENHKVSLAIPSFLGFSRSPYRRNGERQNPLNNTLLNTALEAQRTRNYGPLQNKLGEMLLHTIEYSNLLVFQIVLENSMRGFPLYIKNRLSESNNVGKATNFFRLRGKHFFNATQNHDIPVGQQFVLSLIQGQIQQALHKKYKAANGDIFENSSFDLLEIMFAVLGGERHRIPSIQVSIVDQLLKIQTNGKNSFSGKVCRRKVQLLLCGNDRALIIPYLNKVFLELKDENWVHAYDAKLMQPLASPTRNGSVRRAANILLALQYHDESDPTVNEAALRIIQKYAEKGELYSPMMREHILSRMFVRTRVDILGLTITARQVFEDHQELIPALIREMIHDRVLMKSSFGRDRMRGIEGPFENDAYYTLCYLNSIYDARNNIMWRSGVSLAGLKIIQHDVWKGYVNQNEVMRVQCSDVNHYIWIPEISSKCRDADRPSAFLESPSENALRNKTSSVISISTWCSFRSLPCFPDVKLGTTVQRCGPCENIESKAM